ncbi:hypothetical protein AAG906_015008 [Vitis piasezkii]|uniref:Phytocyanin domain-containing protein n=2 Tax=Vitis vinifera TaxID=29760 RepID=A0ABY9CLB1_VITVI|nr:mavicyanin [Vitis vinifera]WJZ95971.1 hypothetical protein VitviT2T_014702 [Vitis vinifera]|eukprot:XP_002271669.2 PREDICTED: mavicyanin [Vitis vinifera]
MAGVKMIVALLLVVYVSWVGAQTHHVVGGDRGWAKSSEVRDWLSDKVFRVGDKIWFIYSAAQEGVAELRSKEEFESCDVSNPIKMYTDGLDSVPLDGEGIRYFTSSKTESCKDGLKLHVDVQPTSEIGSVATSETFAETLAEGPSAPSAAAHISALSPLFLMGLLICYFGP